MRKFLLALPLIALPSLAGAQDRGVALNMGRGLDNGVSVGWTFKENWTLRPTLAATYSQQTGFRPSVGSTVLRSFGFGHRVYAYAGAGIYYGSVNTGTNPTFGGPGQNPGGAGVSPVNSLAYGPASNVAFVSAPLGLRARLYGNVEAFAEAAYQRTLSGQFGLSHTGQFSGSENERFGATFGVSMRLQ